MFVKQNQQLHVSAVQDSQEAVTHNNASDKLLFKIQVSKLSDLLSINIVRHRNFIVKESKGYDGLVTSRNM
jgi:hypothetical protein